MNSEEELLSAVGGGGDKKGNLQTELETAESIIHGLAQYSEIDVRSITEEKALE
jgi:hypothetical protein